MSGSLGSKNTSDISIRLPAHHRNPFAHYPGLFMGDFLKRMAKLGRMVE